MNRQFFVIIPARYNSTRLPGKPLAEISGLPMIIRVANNAVKSGAKSVTVATDDQRIESVVNQYNYRSSWPRIGRKNKKNIGRVGDKFDPLSIILGLITPVGAWKTRDVPKALLRAGLKHGRRHHSFRIWWLDLERPACWSSALYIPMDRSYYYSLDVISSLRLFLYSHMAHFFFFDVIL